VNPRNSCEDEAKQFKVFHLTNLTNQGSYYLSVLSFSFYYQLLFASPSLLLFQHYRNIRNTRVYKFCIFFRETIN